MSDEKENAHETRAIIHRRLDEQGKQINLLDKIVEINAGVDAHRGQRNTMLSSQRRRSGNASRLSAMAFRD
ncbi:hypothetical protein ACVITL_006571 [Rhizobium pisi]